MSPCTKSIINLLAILCLVYEIQPLRGQMYNYNRLCGSLSKMATNQRLRLCRKSGNNLEVVRVRRDVNTTQQTIKSTTHRQVATTKRPSNECKSTVTLSPNGFSPDGNGLDLAVKCAKDGNWWSAVITWEIPKPEPGRADCVGYRIQWDKPDGWASCYYITDKNVTSYFIDSSKGWERYDESDERLFIAVFPLPQSSAKSIVKYRIFQPPGCSDPAKTTTTSPPLITTLPTTSLPLITTLPSTANATIKNTDTPTVNHTKSGTQSGNQNNVSGPAVSKLVFSIVIASIAVVILAILFLLYKRKREPADGESNRTSEGAPHYISYNASNKSEALDIARWLQDKNVNVIIDKLSFIIPNQRAWSERQLLEAKKIIMIVTPKYLEICNLHQSKSNKEKKWSYNDELVYNEIALINDKLIEKGMATDKFIGILIDTKQKDLPHWMSQLNCYKYKNGKLDEEILRMLKPCTSLCTNV